MFQNLQIVRVRAAEKALREGILEEAHRLASAKDLRENRRAAAVLGSLAERFLERARENYRADRFADALSDLERAEAGGILRNEIAELRGFIRTVATEKIKHDNAKRERINEAVRRIESGSVEAGKRLLEGAANDPAVEELRRAAEDRAVQAERIAVHVEQLIGFERFAEAAQNLRRAKNADARNERITHLEAMLSDRVLANARAALEQGLPGRASDELACLGDLGRTLPARRELADLIGWVRDCGDAVRAHQYGVALRTAMNLSRRMPGAEWVRTIVDQLRQIDEMHTALGAGPLGERAEAGRTLAGRNAARTGEETLVLPGRVAEKADLAERMLLLVDGAGSYLVLRVGQASLGRAAGSDHPADIPLLSDVAERQANIARVEDDYFIFSRSEIEVGGRMTKHQLLRDGDRIVLGRKAKFTFRLPSRKSPSAVLELSDTTKMPHDVRRVILFHRSAVVANSPAAHVFCRNAATNLVLFERNGSLWIRPHGEEFPEAESRALQPGEPLEVEGVSMAVKAWAPRTT